MDNWRRFTYHRLWQWTKSCHNSSPLAQVCSVELKIGCKVPLPIYTNCTLKSKENQQTNKKNIKRNWKQQTFPHSNPSKRVVFWFCNVSIKDKSCSIIDHWAHKLERHLQSESLINVVFSHKCECNCVPIFRCSWKREHSQNLWYQKLGKGDNIRQWTKMQSYLKYKICYKNHHFFADLKYMIKIISLNGLFF